MRLLHIHEDRTPSLANYLNEHPPLPLAGTPQNHSIYDAIQRLMNAGTLRPDWSVGPDMLNAFHWGKVVKNAWYEEMEYEPESDPLDNTRDEFSKDGDLPIEVVIVVKGAGQFEGQFAWHTENQDRRSRMFLGNLAWSPSTPDGPATPKEDALRWVEGKPPKIPWRYGHSWQDLTSND